MKFNIGFRFKKKKISPLGRACIVKNTLVQWQNGDNKSLMCEAHHYFEPLLCHS